MLHAFTAHWVSQASSCVAEKQSRDSLAMSTSGAKEASVEPFVPTIREDLCLEPVGFRTPQSRMREETGRTDGSERKEPARNTILKVHLTHADRQNKILLQKPGWGGVLLRAFHVPCVLK